MPIYCLRVQEVFQSLETIPNGLSPAQVQARLALYGKNNLTLEPITSPWRKIISYLTHPMAILLWVAGCVATVVGELDLGIIIWLLVLVNAIFSFWREHRAEQALEGLKKLLPAHARVIREGMEVMVLSSDIVPGDLLVLSEGDHIPADARIVEEFGLRINNANLTGEAMPARKTADASVREGISEVERPNLIFAGTSVVSGTGRGVIYATGMLTQFGRIAHLTQAVREEPSPIQKELSRITRVISYVAFCIGALVFIIGAFDVGLGIFESFLLALGILVAVVPEGLPATITLSLAMAGQRLAKKAVLVKKLSTIETLGNISIICTDKSGTLTQNQMTVREIWVALKRMTVSGVGYEPKGRFLPDPADEPFEGDMFELLTGALLCNNSRLTPPTDENPKWTSLGDQTEVALRVVSIKSGLIEKQLQAIHPRIHELPFDARRKRMTTIHRSHSVEIAYVKGAPREVLQICSHIRIHGETRPMDENIRAEILDANDDYARSALRVLAIASRELPPRSGAYTVDNIEKDLTFLGLLAMMDPPRDEVAEAVKKCREASIRMIMITGDYGLTAESLARRVGMLSDPNPIIMTGAELDQLNDLELSGILDQEIIFARMAPEHKLRLVAAYQEHGEVVAVTGDGVNDAPALRKADIGISMGVIGTDVAKEAADVIIADDNFATIVSAIEEGRAVYDNLRKFITYIFSSNIPEVMPFLMTAMFNIPLALTVKQILAIDMGTDLFPALALGVEKPEPDVMHRPPRRRSQRLVDNKLLLRAFLWLGIIEAFLCFIGFFFILRGIGGSYFPMLKGLGIMPGELGLSTMQRYLLAITVFHAGVVMAQVGNVFACRTERNTGKHLGWLSNPYLLAGIAVEIMIILGLIYIPYLSKAFDHYPIPPIYWLGLACFGPILYSLEWIRKSLVRLRWFSLRNNSKGGHTYENHHHGLRQGR